MAEWLKAHAWKACLGETLTWVRIPLSPPTSLNCREFSQPAAAKYAKLAHFWRYLLNNMDWRERTARRRMASLSRLFSGDAMSSPTFKLLGRRTTSDHKPNGSPRRTSLLDPFYGGGC